MTPQQIKDATRFWVIQMSPAHACLDQIRSSWSTFEEAATDAETKAKAYGGDWRVAQCVGVAFTTRVIKRLPV